MPKITASEPSSTPQRVDHTETLDMLRGGITGRTFIESKVLPMVENLVARLGDEDAIDQLKISHAEITKQADDDRRKAVAAQRTYDDLISDPNRLAMAIRNVVTATATVTEDGKRRLEKLLEEFTVAWHEEAVGRLGAELVRAAEAQDALRAPGGRRVGQVQARPGHRGPARRRPDGGSAEAPGAVT